MLPVLCCSVALLLCQRHVRLLVACCLLLPSVASFCCFLLLRVLAACALLCCLLLVLAACALLCCVCLLLAACCLLLAACCLLLVLRVLSPSETSPVLICLPVPIRCLSVCLPSSLQSVHFQHPHTCVLTFLCPTHRTHPVLRSHPPHNRRPRAPNTRTLRNSTTHHNLRASPLGPQVSIPGLLSCPSHLCSVAYHLVLVRSSESPCLICCVLSSSARCYFSSASFRPFLHPTFACRVRVVV